MEVQYDERQYYEQYEELNEAVKKKEKSMKSRSFSTLGVFGHSFDVNALNKIPVDGFTSEVLVTDSRYFQRAEAIVKMVEDDICLLVYPQNKFFWKMFF